jgi:hypothetical protein
MGMPGPVMYLGASDGLPHSRAARVVPVERLIDDLWGEEVPETAPKAVQIFVSKLRKVLPEGCLQTLRVAASPSGGAKTLARSCARTQPFDQRRPPSRTGVSQAAARGGRQAPPTQGW